MAPLHTGIKLNTLCLHNSWLVLELCLVFSLHIWCSYMYFCCIIVYLVFVQPRIVSRMVIFISLFDFVYHCIVVLLSPSCRNCIVGMVIHVMRDMWRKRYFCLMLCLVYIILLIMIIINIKEKKEINNMNIYYSTCVLTDYVY